MNSGVLGEAGVVGSSPNLSGEMNVRWFDSTTTLFIFVVINCALNSKMQESSQLTKIGRMASLPKPALCITVSRYAEWRNCQNLF